MTKASVSGYDGLVVLALESRRAAEIAELIRRHGGTPISAPSVREIPLEPSDAVLTFVERLERTAVDVIILLTGVGTRALVESVARRCPRDRFTELLGRCQLVARGPKPVATLRALGLTPTLAVPEPNTWREILAALDRELPIRGRCVAVQEYGASNPELLAGLRERGADVLVVPVYRWALPEDIGPLRTAAAALAAGQIDIALFTSATQVNHLFLVANQHGIDAPRLERAFRRVLIASIGPVCSAALRAHGLQPDLEPEHAKMGQLVAAAARQGPALLAAKRRMSGES